MEKIQNKCYTQETRQWGIPSINIEISSHKLGSENLIELRLPFMVMLKKANVGSIHLAQDWVW